MTEVPEHLLARARAARQRSETDGFEKENMPDDHAEENIGEIRTSEDVLYFSAAEVNITPKIPEHILARSRAAKEKALQKRAGTARAVGSTLGQVIADSMTVESPVAECSVAASDAAMSARNIFNSTSVHERPGRLLTPAEKARIDYAEQTRYSRYSRQRYATYEEPYYSENSGPKVADLYLPEQGFKSEVRVIKKLLGETELSTGFSIEFGIAAPVQEEKRLLRKPKYTYQDNNLTLVALVRGEIAFPVIRFNRSEQGYCDYLQFYGEEQMDELESINFFGWGQDENGSRFDAVLLVQSMLDHYEDYGELNSDTMRKVLEVTRFERRLSARMGESNAAIEQIMKHVFSEQAHKDEYEHTFPDVEVGKVVTDLVGQVVLESRQDDDHNVYATVRVQPKSQMDKDWRTKQLVINRFGGISQLAESGEYYAAKEVDIRLLHALLFSGDEPDMETPKYNMGSIPRSAFTGERPTSPPPKPLRQQKVYREDLM